jgi:hypothetical protein
MPLREFGRFRHLRAQRPCNLIGAARPVPAPEQAPVVMPRLPVAWAERVAHAAGEILPSLLPAFARVPTRLGLRNPLPGSPQQSALSTAPRAANPTTFAAPAARQAVRIYRGPARFIMVGTINEVCSMIDRCIADENAGRQAGLFD